MKGRGWRSSEDLKHESEREVRQPEGLSFGWLLGPERQIVDNHNGMYGKNVLISDSVV